MIREPKQTPIVITDYVNIINSDNLDVHIPNEHYSCILVKVPYDNKKYIVYISCDEDNNFIEGYLSKFLLEYILNEYKKYEEIEYSILSNLYNDNINDNIKNTNNLIEKLLKEKYIIVKEIDSEEISFDKKDNNVLNIKNKQKTISNEEDFVYVDDEKTQSKENTTKEVYINEDMITPDVKDDSLNINLKKDDREYNLSICSYKDNKLILPKEFYDKTGKIDGIIMFDIFLRFYKKDNIEEYMPNKKTKKYVCENNVTFTINDEKRIYKNRNEQNIPFMENLKDGYVRMSNKSYFDIIPFSAMEEYLCVNELQSFYEEYLKLYEKFLEDNIHTPGGYN